MAVWVPRLEAALQDLSSETKDLAKHLNTLYEHNLLCRPDPVQFILIGDTSHSQSTVLAALLDLRLPLKEHEASTPQMVTEYALYPKLLASERDFSLVSEEASSTERLNDSSTDQTALSATILDPLLHARHRTFRLSAEDIVGMTFVYLPRREQVEDHSQQLMTSIISKPNTVLLPILSAQQPVEKSEAVRIARKFDPKSERTLGIITRLDLISPADHTDYFSFMAQDPRERTLGWHVLYNNPIARSNDYDTERESDEELYFKNKFSSSHVLPKDQGIAALRKKLSKIALDHLREFSLPSITRNIREMISEKEGRLYQLGVRKTSVDEMRKYLHEVVDRTRNLTTAALNGDYSDRFFTAPARDKLPPLPDHSNIKRLRSTVCDLNDLFLHMMSTKGAPRRFLSHPAPDGKPFEEHPLPAHLSALLQLYSIPSPCVLLLENFVLEASERQTRSRLSNHALAVELFREQIARWEDVGRTHLRNIFHLAKNFTETLLAHIVGDEGSIYRRLLVDFVNPFYNAKWNELVQKLVELLRHYQEGFIQPLYDASSPVGINRENGAGSLSIWNKSGPGVDRPEVERVVRSVIQYYQVSMRTFVENVKVLAGESSLLSQMPNILKVDDIYNLSIAKIESIVAESSELDVCRRKPQIDRMMLNEALQACNQHSANHGQATSRALLVMSSSSQPTRPDLRSSGLEGSTQTQSGRPLTTLDLEALSIPSEIPASLWTGASIKPDEKETSAYQCITFLSHCSGVSTEELRLMHYLRGNPRYMVSQASDKVSGQKRGGEEQANPTGIPPPKKQLMAPGKGSKEIPAGRG